jgi:hypothetical protein
VFSRRSKERNVFVLECQAVQDFCFEMSGTTHQRTWRHIPEDTNSKDEKSGACSGHGREMECKHNFGEKPEGKTPLRKQTWMGE